jgi:hypothetical protein
MRRACTDAAITALDISGKADVKDGLVQLPQAVHWTTPAAISPVPPTTAMNFKSSGGCPTRAPAECSAVGSIIPLTPSGTTPITMGNLSVSAGAEVHLKAGIYQVNTLDINGTQISNPPMPVSGLKRAS